MLKNYLQMKKTNIAMILFFVLLVICTVESDFLLCKIVFATESNAASKKPPLRVLKLDNTAVTDKELGEIVSGNLELVELTLGGTKITDAGLDHLVRLNKLRKIRLSNTAITDAAGEKLAKIPTLQDIDVSQTEFGDTGFASLQPLLKLKSLNIYLTNVTDKGLEAIKDFGSLKVLTRLNLDLCPISNTGVRNILAAESLEWIHLGGTEITDAVTPEIIKFKKLKEIIVTKTDVTKSGAENLRKILPTCKIQDNISNNITTEQINQAKELRKKKKQNTTK
jgi:Leucine-rich repeat (LRR) protein